ncbi:SDR family NAD(P)-dependent oxidoreductase [Solwaraspora sp. WMMD791]|uniref:SDR family NAD(P)-dependent oxidoreductase n=1 Tax=Solwaraspora sp. WMMD791 TaxID=3016086 RepID=UPI00249A1889|nr:SDR family NAD(P)-dependent oxidoreductase [Solwaraspora sp. WMMD791]WFE26107.1 SDR family NAD(P)-dependent oxidoreductase [Solwaraspora sp. WMMD791]
MTPKVWFITGASRGFGRVWTEAALERGDWVAATARDALVLDALVDRYGGRILPLDLDVRDRAAVRAAVWAAHERFGRLDVVVNNAGYALFGSVEDVTENEARAQLDTNFFGPLWVVQAALPILRAQRSGHIVQVSSIAGIASWPMLGLYHASKYALEGLSDSLAQEVVRFGIRVTILEPGPYRTDWRGKSAVWAVPSSPYAESAAPSSGYPPGDPISTVTPLMHIVDSPEPPLRAVFDDAVLSLLKTVYQDRIRAWEDWTVVGAQESAATQT